MRSWDYPERSGCWSVALPSGVSPTCHARLATAVDVRLPLWVRTDSPSNSKQKQFRYPHHLFPTYLADAGDRSQ